MLGECRGCQGDERPSEGIVDEGRDQHGADGGRAQEARHGRDWHRRRIPDTTSTGSRAAGTIGGGRRVTVEYEKAPWVEATVRTSLPEASASMYDMWFYVNHGCDSTILCIQHYNGNDDEDIPHDFMGKDLTWGKQCIVKS